ncbi:MAG: Uma2 family endonuclease [Myxococcota bacterium]
MTRARTKQPATYQDVLDAPEHMVAEILNGELHLSPRPASPHARASSRLGHYLGPFDDPEDDEPGGWIILDEPELHLAAHVLVPDLGGWRRERMPEMPRAPFFTLAPDWVCEVASPSTQSPRDPACPGPAEAALLAAQAQGGTEGRPRPCIDRMLKMPIYREAGVEWLWLVDPEAHLIEVFRGDGRGWTLAAQAAGAGLVRLPPFEAIELDPGRWFRD